MFNNQVIAGSSGQGGGFYDFPIDQSLRFNQGDSAKLSWTPASSGNSNTWTWSGWVKRGTLSNPSYHLFGAVGSTYDAIWFDSNNRIQFVIDSANAYNMIWSPVFRDVGAFYHLLMRVDTTQASAADRIRLYVNGEQVTALNTNNPPSQNYNWLNINTTDTHYIGANNTSAYFDGYMADVNFIDGQALDPTSFGELKSGIWIPKDTAGLTFGTNGFRLQYGDSAAIGDDTSGNTNDWTVNNLVASDVVLDGVTNNFATMNPLAKGSGTVTFSEGNLKSSFTFILATTEHGSTYTLPQSGKWYWEQRFTGALTNGSQALLCGIMDVDTLTVGNSGNKLTSSGDYVTFYTYNNRMYINNSFTEYTSEIATQTSAIVGFAVDMDNGHLWVHVNGTYINGTPNFSTGGNKVASPNTDSTYMPFFNGNGGGSGTWIANFGQDSTFAGNETAGGNTDANGYGDFKYAVPSSYLALCSANLPTGAINTLNDETPKDYFNTVLWTGDNTNNRQITGVGFQPSLVAAKSRPAISGFNWADAVRGGTKYLQSNTTNAEGTANIIMSFDSDGFSVGDGNGYDVNKSGEAVVGWSWKANGSGVSNTDGSITSTVSVGATSQQNWVSVASYTGNGTAGATVGHGLDGTVPDMIIVKSRDNARDWRVYHSSLGSAYTLDFNTINAVAGPSTAYWNSTDPTSSVFSIGSVTTVNGSGEDYIAYCFANAENLCRVGKYTGNGSTDGVFVHTGHRPAFLLIKETGNANSWELFDTARDPDNVASQRIFPNSSIAEATTNPSLDILSNGFKARAGNTGINRSGGSYIFLSISEQPFKFANAR